MFRLSCLASAFAAVLVLASSASAGETMRLEWVIQGQFAGPLWALEKGYYKEAGVEMELLPAGPDIKPAVTVSQGTDSFGIGHPNQVISARANGAPLVSVAQLGHRSASVYVAKTSTGITSIKDMKGHSAGLWFGGDEHEFLAMLNAAGIPQEDVKIVNQGFDIIAWLNGDYEVMQATIYNELQQVYRQGIKKDDLDFLDASESGVALVNTGIFTTEKVIAERPDAVQAVGTATMRGWKEAPPTRRRRPRSSSNTTRRRKPRSRSIRSRRWANCSARASPRKASSGSR